PGDERSYCATVMVACTPQNPAIAAGATYPFTTNLCHPSKFHGASNASAKATLAGAAAQERTDTGTAIDPHRARGVAGGDAVAPARAGNQRAADRGDSPLAGTQQPEPMMIRIPCSECEGRGLFTLGNSIDPYAKLYECEQCGGDGAARCSECDDGTPATALRCVECTPPLSMPLCARHAAEYAAEELV